MERRHFIKNSALTLALLAISKNELFAYDFNYRAYNFRSLRNNMGIFTEQGGTIAWLNSSEGFVVVDAQFPNTAPHVIDELKKLANKPFKYLINTHHHTDHTSGNIAFKGIAENIIAHQNSKSNQQKSAVEAKNENKQLYPNLTFADIWKTKVGKEYIKAYYYGAGHTNGDAIIHFEQANIVHMGDLVFNRKFPYIDKPKGANIHNWIQVLEKVQKQFNNDTLFIWGHSLDPEKVTGTKADLKAFQDYLQRLLDFVALEIKAGKSLESIKVNAIPAAEEWKGEGIERSISAAYQELKTGM